MSFNPKGYKHGGYNVICDTCGLRYKNDELKQRWDGRMVCEKDWEPQQPMDFQRIPRTEKSIPWSRPEPAVSYDSVTFTDTVEDVPTGTFNVNDPIGSSHGVR